MRDKVQHIPSVVVVFVCVLVEVRVNPLYSVRCTTVPPYFSSTCTEYLHCTLVLRTRAGCLSPPEPALSTLHSPLSAVRTEVLCFPSCENRPTVIVLCTGTCTEYAALPEFHLWPASMKAGRVAAAGRPPLRFSRDMICLRSMNMLQLSCHATTRRPRSPAVFFACL
jgi:hypothetical protein